MKKRVMVAMSGGVDSSAAVVLLKQQGYDVTGVTLRLFQGEAGETEEKKTEAEDAKRVAEKLSIPHETWDLEELFRKKVIDPFAQSYREGLTPNPCIFCNRHIKFGAMLEKAMEKGYDYFATGHYATVEFDTEIGRYLLKKAADSAKDQTYVLYSLTQKQLSHLLLPLGNLSKSQIRLLAAKEGLLNADKPDSQDICFVPDGDYAGFLERYLSQRFTPGDIVTLQGETVGSHNGIERYTIGQRKGLGIALGKPQFVLRKDPQTHEIIVGDERDLFAEELVAEDVNLISVSAIKGKMHVQVKTRYSQKEQGAVILQRPDGNIQVQFDTPQRALTPGQAVVFYDRDIVVGGGTIAL